MDSVIPCSKYCGHTSSTTDKYGDGKPVCDHCMDYLDRTRWAAEHGFPVPAAGSMWSSPKPCAVLNA